MIHEDSVELFRFSCQIVSTVPQDSVLQELYLMEWLLVYWVSFGTDLTFFYSMKGL